MPCKIFWNKRGDTNLSLEKCGWAVVCVREKSGSLGSREWGPVLEFVHPGSGRPWIWWSLVQLDLCTQWFQNPMNPGTNFRPPADPGSRRLLEGSLDAKYLNRSTLPSLRLYGTEPSEKKEPGLVKKIVHKKNPRKLTRKKETLFKRRKETSVVSPANRGSRSGAQTLAEGQNTNMQKAQKLPFWFKFIWKDFSTGGGGGAGVKGPWIRQR